jgi:hypothetical protein
VKNNPREILNTHNCNIAPLKLTHIAHRFMVCSSRVGSLLSSGLPNLRRLSEAENVAQSGSRANQRGSCFQLTERGQASSATLDSVIRLSKAQRHIVAPSSLFPDNYNSTCRIIQILSRIDIDLPLAVISVDLN